jgi:hypothetical protein
MAFTREELLEIADNASRAGDKTSATEAMQMLDQLDASNRQKNIDAFEGSSQLGKAGTAISDMANAGLHGLTFGLDDRAAAGLHTLAGNIGSTLGLSGDVDYDQALAQEQQNTRARGDRMEHIMPGSTGTFEALGSLGMPGGVLKAGVAKAAPWAGKTGKVVADILENAGYGTVSAYGHGQNPLEGAGVGAAGTVLGPLFRGAVPAATKYGLGLKGAAVGGATAGFPGAWAGAEAGRWVGNKAKQGMETVLDTAPSRAALATLSAAPGRLYGWLRGQ